MNENVKSIIKEIVQWFEIIAIAILLSILVRGFLFETLVIDGISMQDTFVTNQRVILNKIGLKFNDLEKEDIVVIEVEKKQFKSFEFLNNISFFQKLLATSTSIDYIKRIIAIEGDKIQFINGYVYVNDIMIEESYIKTQGVTSQGTYKNPYIIPEGYVYVLGDNRKFSADSRKLGPINIDKILGTVSFRIWPLSEFGKVD